jgi:hypothetical protein
VSVTYANVSFVRYVCRAYERKLYVPLDAAVRVIVIVALACGPRLCTPQ